MNTRLQRIVTALACLIFALLYVACGSTISSLPLQSALQPATAQPKARPSAVPSTKPTAWPKVRATATPTLAESGLPQARVSELPPEVATTLDLIAQGGPFPYERDGITFQNRERLLPRKPQGYYREYTVSTPGEDDRGARRLIVGKQGEIYYTADHYASFVEVVP